MESLPLEVVIEHVLPCLPVETLYDIRGYNDAFENIFQKRVQELLMTDVEQLFAMCLKNNNHQLLAKILQRSLEPSLLVSLLDMIVDKKDGPMLLTVIDSVDQSLLFLSILNNPQSIDLVWMISLLSKRDEYLHKLLRNVSLRSRFRECINDHNMELISNMSLSKRTACDIASLLINLDMNKEAMIIIRRHNLGCSIL